MSCLQLAGRVGGWGRRGGSGGSAHLQLVVVGVGRVGREDAEDVGDAARDEQPDVAVLVRHEELGGEVDGQLAVLAVLLLLPHLLEGSRQQLHRRRRQTDRHEIDTRWMVSWRYWLSSSSCPISWKARDNSCTATAAAARQTPL